MIGGLRGKVVKGPPRMLLDVGRVYIEIFTPFYQNLPEEVTLHTVLRCHQTRNGMEFRLYGFLTDEEKRVFLKLIDVKDIGPSKALNILSTIPVDELARVVEKGDYERLSQVPGIGKKTAMRIIGELGGKLLPTPGSSVREEAKEALISLGYTQKEADMVLDKLSLEGKDVEEVLKEALKLIYEGSKS